MIARRQGITKDIDIFSLLKAFLRPSAIHDLDFGDVGLCSKSAGQSPACRLLQVTDSVSQDASHVLRQQGAVGSCVDQEHHLVRPPARSVDVRIFERLPGRERARGAPQRKDSRRR